MVASKMENHGARKEMKLQKRHLQDLSARFAWIYHLPCTAHRPPGLYLYSSTLELSLACVGCLDPWAKPMLEVLGWLLNSLVASPTWMVAYQF